MNTYHLFEPSSEPIIQTALSILRPRFPKCLPLYRRLQFGRFYPTSYLLTNLNLRDPILAAATHHSGPFLVAFIDRSVRPETEVWLYGSFESSSSPTASDGIIRRICRDFATTVHSLAVPKSFHGECGSGGTVGKGNALSSHMTDGRTLLFGAVGEGARDVLRDVGVMSHGAGDQAGAMPNHVFIWEVEKWVGSDEELEGGLTWGSVRREDLGIVRSRTVIPRQERTLAGLPSMGIYNEQGRIVAWAFVGLDASLTALHVEEEFRGRGLAKKLTAKLFREKMDRFWEDGMPKVAHGNVMYGNEASAAMCRSLGGEDVGRCYWLKERLRTG